jgi:hypothetical protein
MQTRIGVGVMNDEEAKEIFKKIFSLVLLGSGIQEESEAELCFFRNQNPNISIVQHYGGGVVC